jgi:hypothetical protein
MTMGDANLIGVGMTVAGVMSALIGIFLPDSFLHWRFDRSTALGLALIFVIIGCATTALIGGLS